MATKQTIEKIRAMNVERARISLQRFELARQQYENEREDFRLMTEWLNAIEQD